MNPPWPGTQGQRSGLRGLLLDPNVGATLTTAQAVAMCDELLEAHRALLPPALTR